MPSSAPNPGFQSVFVITGCHFKRTSAKNLEERDRTWQRSAPYLSAVFDRSVLSMNIYAFCLNIILVGPLCTIPYNLLHYIHLARFLRLLLLVPHQMESKTNCGLWNSIGHPVSIYRRVFIFAVFMAVACTCMAGNSPRRLWRLSTASQEEVWLLLTWPLLHGPMLAYLM